MATNSNMIPWWRVSFAEEEIEQLTKAIRGEHISQGAVTAELEARLAKALGVPYVTATTSGSMALLMASMVLGIGPGDEVIIPNRTWIATAHAPLLLGAKIVLVDVLPDAPSIDVDQIRKKITPRTKAIYPVELNGRAVNMDEVWRIAKEYGLHVIEDSTQGLFCKYTGQHADKFMGTESDAGCFSFSVAKLLPTGQGGFVATKHKEIYEKLKRVKMHGLDSVIDCEFTNLGFNFRFTDLQAAFGLAQLDRIPARIKKLNDLYLKYEKALKDMPFLKMIPVDISKNQIPIYIDVLCKQREELISFLAAQGIQARPFHPDLDTAKYLNSSGEFPNSRVFGTQGLVLPCGPEQTLENIDRVIGALQLFGKSNLMSTGI